MKRFTIAAALVWALGGTATASEGRPFAWADLFGMVRLSDPQPAPLGTWILYTRAEYDVAANKSNKDLAIVSMDGKTERRLTVHEGADSNGRWTPDGQTILFLSARSGSSQVWKMSLEGGEPSRVTDLPVDVDGFEPSPDGKWILFWSAVYPDCKDLACTAERLKEREKSPIKARTYDRLFVRHWDAWEDGRRNHLFVLPAAGGEPRDLMPGSDQDAPTKPFGGGEDAAWSPDSRKIVFVSQPADGEAWSTNYELYEISVADASAPRLLTTNPARDERPVFSPDGSKLAQLAMDRPGYEADRMRIVLWDLAAGTKRTIADGWDRSVSEMAFSSDGKKLYVTAAEQGRSKIFEVNLETGKALPIVEEGKSQALRFSRGRLVFLRERLTAPAEIHTADPVSKSVFQVTQANREKLKGLALSRPEEFWFENGGFKIHGFVVKPVGFDPAKKYPLAFLIHGGPQGYFGDDFHYRWNPQFYAGAGYVAVMINFRGSTGYGQKFTDAIRGNWGPGPYSDLMAGLKHLLAKSPYIDKDRICALGASYGGYMVNWINGQEHPFKCLVAHDGDFDMVSSYYNTEELWFPEWEMLGPPWKSREVYDRNNPALRVERWKTPTLVIHGGKDFRVVETEGLSTFTALQRLGVPSRLLHFPDENHWVLKPQNSKLWHETVLAWLDRWTGTKR